MTDVAAFSLPASPVPGGVAWRRVAGDVPAALGVLAATLVILALTGFIGR